ncbi:RNA polymerase sigma factor [Hymenobacter sp. HDW8]|uniref:RNA polymerase sigma factor n=1 Tax=Hymenobacter sp. HDW8 TaxID=2714932 RepID=UPI0014084BB0|nr:sigma-70 family RNA polymerase sigma factor [Hymenobacter sp. HDW8]QIL76639.1 sigma-70 family RNA polymerase sigma factor [Hymenobacter sp. HDW8]
MKLLHSSPTIPAEPVAALRQALLHDREAALTKLYRRAFPMVRRQVKQLGGTEQDAQDVFHDALVVFYEKAMGGTLVLTASASTYLVSVSRNLWRQELSRRNRHPSTEWQEDTQAADETAVATPESEEAFSVLSYVEQLGEKCKSILLSFYYFQQPLEQIASTHNYSSVRSATVQKFKCLERLRKSVRAVRAELLAY